MTDITKFAVSPTSTMPVLSANDEPILGSDKQPASITLYGPGSAEFQRAQAKNNNRAIEKLRRKGKVEQTPQERLAERADFLAACTASVQNISHPDFPAGGPDMIRAIYAAPELGFIADQVERYIGEWSNFSKGSVNS